MIFYYKDENNDKAYWLNDKDEFMITNFYDMPKRNCFEMFENYLQTESDLRQFKADMILWDMGSLLIKIDKRIKCLSDRGD